MRGTLDSGSFPSRRFFDWFTEVRITFSVGCSLLHRLLTLLLQATVTCYFVPLRLRNICREDNSMIAIAIGISTKVAFASGACGGR